MKILVIGSGGREHALCWKIAQSDKAEKIFCTPGNAGTSLIAQNINIKADDLEGLLKFAKDEKIDLTCVGPEIPLVMGIVDLFNQNGLKVFGPNKAAALLEGSKIYAKEIMKKYNIPTADFAVFTDAQQAKDYIKEKGVPIVVKADGLAAGKGVYVCTTGEEAEKAIDDSLVKKIFGDAGNQIVIEQALKGEEASILVLCDGKDRVILESSQDHKRVFDHDEGPNTGGMGAYSPAPLVTRDLLTKITDEIIDPLIKGMEREGHPYKGILYVGVMVTEDGPKVLEFNVRFGDPETQVILPRIKGDLIELMEASATGQLKNCQATWDPRSCVSVVIASGGYPGSYEKKKVINGLDYFTGKNDVFVFHAGTALNEKDEIITNGGRVLNVTGLGDSVKETIDKVYQALGHISFENMHFRRDIGYRALNSGNCVLK